MQRICGSPDLYPPEQRENASVNFLTCHDGFTLYDLYAYNEKHNERNGWDNTDGATDNNSWNCGAEGETDDPAINALRSRLRKNAFAVLLCSRGAAMFPAGDEFGNTQFGNNNPYCQDNEISWLDWDRLADHRDLFDFVRRMIALRRAHPVLRRATTPAECGWEDISLHNNGQAWTAGRTWRPARSACCSPAATPTTRTTIWCCWPSTRIGSRMRSGSPHRRRGCAGGW